MCPGPARAETAPRKLGTISGDAGGEREFREGAKKTAGTVLQFRKAFEDFFCQFSRSQIAEGVWATLTRSQKAIYERSKDKPLSWQQFSDTFVFYSPVGNAHKDLSVNPVYQTLAACCMAMTYALAGRFPLRGGVTIGTGMLLTPGNFYGPALAEAHRLESQVAEYPRIVIADELVRYLHADEYSSEPTIDEIMKALARTTRTLLSRDRDGCVIADFYGEGMRAAASGKEHISRQAIEAGYRFVSGEVSRCAPADKNRLARRYARLLDYMTPRLSNWGLSREEMA